MAADDKPGLRPGRDGAGHTISHAAVAWSVGTGIVISGGLIALGSNRWQAIGMGLLGLGAVLWFGAIAPGRPAAVLDERTRRQRHRNFGIGLALVALVSIFYIATIIRLGPNALRKDMYPTAGQSGKNVIIEDKSSGRSPSGQRPVGDGSSPACKAAGTC